MTLVTGIRTRRAYNSHVRPTIEFLVELDSGQVGVAAPSQGETVSIYEDQPCVSGSDGQVTRTLLGTVRHALVGREWTQQSWDEALGALVDRLGRNSSSALSEAFFNARRLAGYEAGFGAPLTGGAAPRLCINVLNGGFHAYTNPVLSDFPEYLLMARSADVEMVVAAQNDLQAKVAERLRGFETEFIGGNPVNRLGTRDNRAVLDFLLAVRDDSGYADYFDPWLDASAGDLWNGRAYLHRVTDQFARSSAELVEFWCEVVRDYGLAYLEDPFHERDFEAWRELTSRIGTQCVVVGDNFYATDPKRILEGAQQGYATGAIIKPNQAGSVTAAREAIVACRQTDQVVVTSHRSISTESTFVCWLSVHDHADAIKIGPLATDYSSVVRLNEILRLTEMAD